MEYDLIVVGAGTAGAIATRFGAEKGLKVLLIDAKPREKIGEKICGDAIGRHHFDYLKIDLPKGKELTRHIDGIDVYSPDRETVFRVGGHGLDGYIIDRLEFGQRLVNEAIAAGAELRDSTRVLEPIIENNMMVGVVIHTPTGKEEIRGKVTIDASGMGAILRRKVPDSWNMEKNVDWEDVAINYREIREINTKLESPEYARIYLSQEAAPGGYIWVFPKNETENGMIVNTGLGVGMFKGHPDPRKQYEKYVLSMNMFKGSKLIHSGGAPVTVRRPLDTLVGNGFMLAGDSGSCANPVHGGGIGSSMIAGKLAAETAAEAIENGDVSQRGLWIYNKRYNVAYGAKQAALDVFRIFLQSLKDSDLSYGMKAQLITEEDLLKANLGEDLRLNAGEKVIRFLRGVKKLGLLNNLKYVADKMKEVKQLYLNYPETIDGYSEWRKQVHKIFDDLKAKYWGKR
ncbi:MAG: geranylgeranyl reductase family protein [Candidatus Odinarchaeota archaeon]|nr:geranylgeranyl reductase family protein [Candidatus Odinarchaeota archaeon]